MMVHLLETGKFGGEFGGGEVKSNLWATVCFRLLARPSGEGGWGGS